MTDRIRLTDENAGGVVAWLKNKTLDPSIAVMRGGPRGGSIGALVGIADRDGRRHWAEPGDTIALGMDGQPYIEADYA